jgi:RNA 2',3'-cyclic 3'-phosphodiesterase
MSKIRAFFAVNTSFENQMKISEVQSRFKEIRSDVKWDTKDKFHITLKFLGDIEESALKEMTDNVKTELVNFNQFKITYKGVGAFPNLKFPRIIWIGCESENDRINKLSKIIDDIAFNYNFEKEKKKFHPHITLGRVKGERGIQEIITLLNENRFDEFTGNIESIEVMQSTLLSSGSIYKIIDKISLKK